MNINRLRCLIARGITLLICSASALVQVAFADGLGCPPEHALAQTTTEQSVDTDASDTHGILWKVKPPDAPGSYLFGTIHLPITRLPPLVALALAKADRFVAETELNQTAMAYYQRHTVSKAGANHVLALEPPLRERVLELLTSYGVERRVALHLKLWAAFSLLSRPVPTGAPTLDEVLANAARQYSKPISALQSIEELVKTLEGIPLDHQREILIDTTCNRARLQRQGEALITRYLEGDLAGMLAASRRYQARDPAIARAFKKRMLDGRNRVMLQRLEPYLRMGNVFVAVGALHLPGEQGLLWGLKARGYRVMAAD